VCSSDDKRLTSASIHETLQAPKEEPMAIEVPSRVQLSDEELDALIDAEARKRLGISGEEFKEKYAKKELPDTPAAREIAMLLKLAA